jgi:methionyl-tRNA formyltransferase
VKIWFATDLNETSSAQPGEIISLGANIHAACGQGVLEIHELQMPGAKRQSAVQFIQGQHVKPGDLFG